MCLATPIQIKRIEGETGIVEHDGKEFEVSLQLIPTAQVGDWVLAHGTLGISILPEKEALEIIRLIEKSQS